jgi:thioredoxin-dependent peroxiredoxin
MRTREPLSILARPPTIALLVLTLLMSLTLGHSATAAPGEGESAPDFILHGTDGRLYTLADHVGKRGVVLAWFPKAFTPG